ncbi:hypothetical protein ABIA96_005588 [Bradyrhizobium sp. LB11.1]
MVAGPICERVEDIRSSSNTPFIEITDDSAAT